ncbi:hypothetical protein B0T19DRAFT_397503 [Cercophora scortea]|uniref:Uncharacterized protein n=1 Tax=Cercophora scortea TaxID=314031 RepID=A0AAE0IV70_9PEZI|nr:hypothetical protein B0T19DRAFT_397503 [Cercophora scortea]
MRLAPIIARAITVLAVGALHAAAIPTPRDTGSSPKGLRSLIQLHQDVDMWPHHRWHANVIEEDPSSSGDDEPGVDPNNAGKEEKDDLPPRIRVDKVDTRTRIRNVPDRQSDSEARGDWTWTWTWTIPLHERRWMRRSIMAS